MNLTDNYPIAPSTGGTPRMRDVINEVNRIDDEENDFIFTSGIKINEYVNSEGDYTKFIMNVLNAAIMVSHQNQEDSRERTIY